MADYRIILLETHSTLEGTLYQKALEFHNQKAIGSLVLSHFGVVDQELIKSFGADLDELIAAIGCGPRVIKRAYHVTVESLQNIVKHGDHPETGEPETAIESAFIVGQDDNTLYFTTGNYINLSRLEKTCEALDTLASLDPDGVKEMYKAQIRGGEISDRGGAGLGFIDITKKTGLPIHYSFEKVSENSAMILLRMQVPKD